MSISVELTHHFFRKTRERIVDIPDERIFETLTHDTGYRNGILCREHVLVGGGSGLYLPYAGVLVPLIRMVEPEKHYRAVTIYHSLPPESLGIEHTKHVKVKWSCADYLLGKNTPAITSEIQTALSAFSFSPPRQALRT